MTPPADEDLMLHVRHGDLRRLGELFERYQTPLYNFHLRMSGNRQISEDLVQEVFLRVLRYRESYRPGTSFRTWVYQIARNAWTDHWRRRKPESGSGDADKFDTIRDEQPTPDERAALRQEEALLRQALTRMSEDKREILLLARYQELKYEEIAELLECEVGAVKVRVFRALQELRSIHGDLMRQTRVRTTGEIV